MAITKSSHVSLFLFGVLAGLCLLSIGRLRAQEDVLPEAVDTSYAEAERKLAEAQLAYVMSANERGEGIYSETLMAQLRMKVDVIDEFIKQQKSGNPSMQAVLLKKAETEVKIAELRLDRVRKSYANEISDQDRVLLSEMAVDVAKQGVERVKSLKTPEELRQWEIGQLQLQLLDVQMRLELSK